MRLSGRSQRPLLSVVVPAYDVEDYLAECLASILAQSHRRLEVVVVDDGSRDRTGEIADRAARHDPRVRVVHQSNAGLGAARNVGVAHASGDYLAFADSDDVVSPRAYERLVGLLERTGSDLAVGAVERDSDDPRHAMPLMRANHREERRAIDIDAAPLLLGDCFAWNKVFRRRFWDDTELSFPLAVRYEDQPTVTRALVEATSIDSVPDTVYQWRVRADGTSITQRRKDIEDLHDRVLTKRWATADVRTGTARRTRDVWFSRVLPVDMWEYFRAVPGCTDDYWELLRVGVAEFWGPDTVPFERTGVPLRQRLMGWLVAEDRREELVCLLEWLDQQGGLLPQRVVGGRALAHHPFTGVPGLPSALVPA